MTKRRSYKKDLEQSEAQRQQLEQEVKLLREQLDAQQAEPPSTQERWLKRNIFTVEIIAIFIAGIVGVQTCRQTTIMAHQDTLIENQNERIDVQIALAEAERRGDLVFLMSNIMDKIDDELKNDWNNDRIRNISPQLIGRIAALSQAMLPYRYLKDSVLIERPLSPERGQLLTALVKTKFDSTAYYDIYENVKFQDADLQNAQLDSAELRGADLSRADLRGADLRGTDLSRAYLKRINLSEAYLIEANLSRADLSEAYLSGANLSRANLSRADLRRADLRRADLSRAYLSRAYLIEANLIEANLSRANLSRAYLSEAYLVAYLGGADLSGADLSGADLSRADLSEANLSRADLSGADLSEADLSEADLIEANLRRAYLNGVILSGADLSQAESITFEQLSESNSLYQGQGIPDTLFTRLQKERPELVIKPDWWDRWMIYKESINN